MGKIIGRMTVGAFALAAIWNVTASTAQAQSTQSAIMKQCGEKWSAAKAANQVPAGMTWPKFLGQCRAETQPAAATAPAPVAPAPAVVPAKPVPTVAPKPVAPKPAPTTASAPATGGMAGQQARIKQCGAEWRANKATLSAQYASWPKYWSACDARLKAAGQ
jgi:hypothetical protein